MDIKKLVSDVEEYASLVALERRMRTAEKEVGDILARLDALDAGLAVARQEAENIPDGPEKVAVLARLNARAAAAAESRRAWSDRFAVSGVSSVVRES